MLDRFKKLIQEHKPVRLTLYGDSICVSNQTANYYGGASCVAQNWGQQLGRLLKKQYPETNFSVTHFAIGGQNSFEGLGRLDWLAEHQPDMVLVAFGANDCGYHFLPPEATYQALHTLIGGIRERHGADVVVIAMGGENPLLPSWQHPDETMAVVKRVVADTASVLADVRSAMLKATMAGRNWDQFHASSQDCHPNDKGHAIWAQATFDAIQQTLLTK